ncbi:MAG: hypothetical protein LBB20_02610 [Puniceicoccales bacterium]|jgi:hypothetical protein|nr:hypothetical protein [Puniceicoccales bacterium]
MDFNTEVINFLVKKKLIKNEPTNVALVDNLKDGLATFLNRIETKDDSISQLKLNGAGLSIACDYSAFIDILCAHEFMELGRKEAQDCVISEQEFYIEAICAILEKALEKFPEFLSYPLDINGEAFLTSDIKKTFMYNALAIIAKSYHNDENNIIFTWIHLKDFSHIMEVLEKCEQPYIDTIVKQFYIDYKDFGNKYSKYSTEEDDDESEESDKSDKSYESEESCESGELDKSVGSEELEESCEPDKSCESGESDKSDKLYEPDRSCESEEPEIKSEKSVKKIAQPLNNKKVRFVSSKK